MRERIDKKRDLVNIHMDKIEHILDECTFPNWAGIVEKIERDLFQNRAILHTQLYHYTSIDGFMSIMQNRDFWISNIHYMNDSQEFENGKSICKKVIKKQMENETAEFQPFFDRLLQICDENASTGFNRIHNRDIFALSFCGDGDILTQWQFYGSGGISIGFENKMGSFDKPALMNEDQYIDEIYNQHVKPEEMLPHNERYLDTHSIIYEDERKYQVFNAILNSGIQFLKRCGLTVMDMCVDGISDALFYYFALMKDPHFSHENERRFLYYINQDDSRIHFRRRGNILLPYIKMKILDVNCRPHKVFPVSDIVIAPGSQQEYVADSVKYFLNKSGYEYLVDKVRLSKIPYRE